MTQFLTPPRPVGVSLREAFEWLVPYEDTEECIRWYHGRFDSGCARLYYDNQRLSAYRVAYQLYHNQGEPLPEGAIVRHLETCQLAKDCVNWRHLTLAEIGSTFCAGESHAMAKLTDAQAAAIFADRKSTQETLARRYRVSTSLIGKIRRGRMRREATGAVPEPPRAPLAAETIRAIYRDSRAPKEVAEAYGVTVATVYNILRLDRASHRQAVGREPALPVRRVHRWLNADQIRAIYNDPRSPSVVAAEYGVDRHTIHNIRLCRARRHKRFIATREGE